MNPGGELKVRLTMLNRRIAQVEIASSRAALPRALFAGRPADDVVRLVPSLYSVCRSAQAAAAAGALDAATGTPATKTTLQQRGNVVRNEAAVEMLTRLLIDWPQAMDAEPDFAAVARVRRCITDELLDTCREVAQSHVFGVDADAWLAAMAADRLTEWLDRGDTLVARLLAELHTGSPDLGVCAIAALPEMTPAELAGEILPRLDEDPSFALHPDWRDAPAETGSLARVGAHPLVAAFVAAHGNSAAARYLARIVELALLLARGASPFALPPSARQHMMPFGIGVGIVETARGALLHVARVDDGKVTDYTIVAPTEWNFHSRGALKQGLLGCSVTDARNAARAARVLVQALDPCVECEIEVADA